MEDGKSTEQVTREGNPARPEGEAGSEMLSRMNESHSGVTNWALGFLRLQPGMEALDIGCGGGATLRRLAVKMGLVDGGGRPAAGTGGHVTGVDYSEVSCRDSREFNADAVATGCIRVVEGSVDALPFPDGSFDAATTVESFYFWPNPEDDVREVARILKPGGTFLLVADIYRKPGLPPEAVEHIRQYKMTVLDPEGYRSLFLSAGFSRCAVHLKEGTDWICVEGTK